jgi:hypothetical protein
MSKIFISYNRKSEAIARSLVNDFESLDYNVWFDQDLSGGQAWWNQILSRIRDCDVFVFLLDPNALESTACKREFGYAAALGKPILPILVADGISTSLLPPELMQIQFIDCRVQDRNSALILARALKSIPPSSPLPDPLPSPPEIPVSYLGGLTRKIEKSTSINFKEQSSLLVELKRSFKEPGSEDDTRTLLKKLRSRRDIYAAIAEEIDDLIGKPEKILNVSSEKNLSESFQKVETFKEPVAPLNPVEPENTPHVVNTRQMDNPSILIEPDAIPVVHNARQKDDNSHQPAPVKITYIERGQGIIIGTLVVIFLLIINASIPERFYASGIHFVSIIIGAITGYLCADRRKVINKALVGYFLGFCIGYILLVALVVGDSESGLFAALSGALILTGVLGALIGAIIGSNIQKKHER